jgi:hypothetical protein
MKIDTQPAKRVRSSAKSFLSILLSTAFVLPTGIGWPAAVAAAVPAAEGGRGVAVPLHGNELANAFASVRDKKAKQDPVLKGLPITELSEDEAILHALNRLAYGPRPGDVERVRQMGLAKWIEQQLDPKSIDDRAAEARLEQFPTLRMSTAKLLEEYPRPKQQENQAAAKEARLELRRSDAAATIGKDLSDK